MLYQQYAIYSQSISTGRVFASYSQRIPASPLNSCGRLSDCCSATYISGHDPRWISTLPVGWFRPTANLPQSHIFVRRHEARRCRHVHVWLLILYYLCVGSMTWQRFFSHFAIEAWYRSASRHTLWPLWFVNDQLLYFRRHIKISSMKID